MLAGHPRVDGLAAELGWTREAVMAVLSDDHCAEAGAAALRGIVAGVLQTGGAEGIADLAIELASKLGEMVEQIAQDQSLPAVDVLDILFID